MVDPRLAELLKTANGDLLDRAIRHALFTYRFGSGESRKLIEFLNSKVFPDLLRQIEGRLENIALKGADTFSNRRFINLTKAIDSIVKEAVADMEKGFSNTLVEFAKREATFQTEVLASSMPIEFNLDTPSPRLLRSIVRSRPMNGRVLRDWWSTVDASTRAAVRQQIQIGIAEGESIPSIVRRLKGTRGAGFSDGILNLTRRQTESVVRTAVNHTSNHARNETYKENSDLIKGVQYVATLDSRTTLRCATLDGEIFELEKGPRPPQHYACRSTTSPVLKSWKELGLKAKDTEESTRASLDGQVSSKLTYSQWLKGQPVAVQDEVLGRARGQLFRSGGLSLDRFVDSKGSTYTLDQLYAAEGIAG